MKKFKVEFDDITTHVGIVEATNLEEVRRFIYSKGVNEVEPCIGETKIKFIEEVKNGDKKS